MAAFAHALRGYTHVSDTSILANRVAQLELALSRLIGRVDAVDIYHDIVHDFEDPLPVYRPGGEGDKDGKQESRDDHGSDGERQRAPVQPQQDSVQACDPAPFRASHGDALSLPEQSQAHDPDSPAHILASIANAGSQVISHGQTPPETGPPVDIELSYGLEPSNHLNFLPNAHTTVPAALDAPRTFSRPLTQEALSMLDPIPSEVVSAAPSVQEHNATMELEEMALGRETHQLKDAPRGGEVVI